MRTIEYNNILKFELRLNGRTGRSTDKKKHDDSKQHNVLHTIIKQLNLTFSIFVATYQNSTN